METSPLRRRCSESTRRRVVILVRNPFRNSATTAKLPIGSCGIQPRRPTITSNQPENREFVLAAAADAKAWLACAAYGAIAECPQSPLFQSSRGSAAARKRPQPGAFVIHAKQLRKVPVHCVRLRLQSCRTIKEVLRRGESAGTAKCFARRTTGMPLSCSNQNAKRRSRRLQSGIE
jgi:hypothetical protein